MVCLLALLSLFVYCILSPLPKCTIEQFVQLAAGDDRERALREQNAKLRDTIAAMREEGATMSVRAQQLEEQVEVWTRCVAWTFAEESSRLYMHPSIHCDGVHLIAHNHPHMISYPPTHSHSHAGHD
jgi:hypothetical protein